MLLNYLRLRHPGTKQLLLLEAETAEQTRIIATKADLIEKQGDKFMLRLHSLKVELQSQFQQQIAIIQEEFASMKENFQQGLTSTKEDLGNFIMGILDSHEKNRDAKFAEEVSPQPADVCLSAKLTVMTTQLRLLTSIGGKQLNNILMNCIYMPIGR